MGHSWRVFRRSYKTYIVVSSRSFKFPISMVVQHNQRRGATLSLVGSLSYPDCTGPSTNCEKLVKQNQYFLTDTDFVCDTIYTVLFNMICIKCFTYYYVWRIITMYEEPQNWDKSWTCEHNLWKIGQSCK